MISLRLAIIFLFACQISQAQVNNAYFHHLTVENGLSEATNSYFYKDSRGFVWITSMSGLNRFDGRQVRVYQPDPADPNALYGQNIQSPFYEDSNGDIWFSTYEGINQYVRKHDNFKHYELKDTSNNKTFASYYIAYLDNEAQLWVLVNEQFVYVFNTKTKHFTKKHDVAPSTQRLTIQADDRRKVMRSFANTWSANNLGFQMADYSFKDTIKQKTYLDEKSEHPLSIQDFFFDENTIWLASLKGLHAFDLEKNSIKDYYLGDRLTSITHYNKDEFITSSIKNGILIFNKKIGKVVSNFRHWDNNSHSVATNIINNAILDSDQGLWVQANNIGVDFTTLTKNKFSTFYHYPESSKLSKPFAATALCIDKNGDLWSGSNGSGIRVFDTNGHIKDSFIVSTPSARGLKFNTVFQSFKDNQERIWLFNFSFLSCFDDKKRVFNHINKNLFFLYGLTTKSRKVLMATYSGVYELKESTKDNFDLEIIENIPSEKPHTILFEDNNGLIWSSYDAISIRIYNSNDNYNMVKELPINGVVTGFWHQPNTSIIWMSSHNGLFKIDKNNWQSKSYTENEGLPSRTINTIQADDNANLWLGTSKGLAQFNTSLEKTQSYNLVDGISDVSFNMYSSAKGQDGTLYFGTNNGITAFNPKQITPLSISARPTITNILINDKITKNLTCTTTGATNMSEIQSLKLPYSDNTLSFNFAAMEYSDPMRCVFQYKMEGVDKDWVNSGTQNFARYANLKAGSYTFLLKAANSDGIWSEKPRILTITIIPPFYQTWWFIILCALATIALVGYIVYLRLSKVIALQKIRLNLYENLHDDIGSRLTAIVLTVDELIQKTTFKDTRLERIGTISRNIVANMRRLVWATAPENDALSTVVQQMQTDRRVLLPSTILFNLKMDKAIENMSIGGDKRYQMLSIFTEALTNIAKYADATTVETSIEILDKQLIMTIEDNGNGFDIQKKREDKPNSSGHGLRNMQRRANRIKGTLEILSVQGKGTTIKLSFPIKDEPFWKKMLSSLS